ncbi:hypothetical protein ABK040_005030 [Willaertia magna]
MEIQEAFGDVKINFNKEIKEIKEIKYGYGVFIILTMDNELYGYAIDENYKNQLSLHEYDELNKFVKLNLNIGQIKYLKCNFIIIFITENNSVFVFGNNFNGELGLGLKYTNKEPITTLTKLENLNLEIKDLQCGLEHAILLDKFGNIYGTGRNFEGQLGLNDNNDKYEFTKINLPFKVKKIACSQYNTSILSENNELFVAESNSYGESGLNNNQNIKYFTKVDCNIKEIYNSFGTYNLYLNSMNEFLMSGDLNNNSNIVYKKFTKIDKIKVNKQYIYPLLLENKLFILQSDYKINDEDKDILLSLKCLQKLNNNQLIDLNIIVIEENRKKRKHF